MKYELKGMYDWTDRKAFSTIDSRGTGFLTFDSVLNFCRMNGFRASESEIIAIIRRLDIDADQHVNFEEFCSTMRVS